jgi:Rrf2 family cysteine metabolism transcriptional repressor
MHLSSKTIYGIQALIEIASGENTGSGIAEAQNIPVKFLEHVLSSLKKGKLITSSRGRRGGYNLSHSPKHISLLNIIETLEGPLSLSKGKRNDSGILVALNKIENKLKGEFKAITLQELIEEQQKFLHYAI